MRRRVQSSSVVLVVLISLAGCAGTIRDNVRKAALYSGEAALTIDALEQKLAASNVPGYSAAQHKQAGQAILVMLEAVRAYERLAKEWPEKVTIPPTILQAMLDAIKAIAAVERIMADVPGNAAILAALEKVKTTIGGK